MSTSDGSTQLLFWTFDYSYWLFLLTDIPYNGDSHKILEMVFVRYVLFKDELILKTVAIICPKSRLNWQQGGLSLHWLQYSVHKCDCWLEIVYHSWFSPSLKPFETKLGKSARHWKFTIDFAHVNLFVWLSFEQLSWNTLKYNGHKNSTNEASLLGSVKFFLGAGKMIFHYYSITNIMQSHDWY